MTIRNYLLLSLIVAFSASAATMKLDSLTVGSDTYSNVTLLGANATDLYFTHSLGIANVKLRYVPEELQKQFHYDPRAAADAERKRMEDDARYHTNLAATIAAQASASAQAARAAATVQNLVDPISEKSMLGKPSPAVEVERWLGEKPSLEGKYVLVSFWAPWSAACRNVIPDLNALQKKFADRLVVVGLCTNSAAEVAEMTAPKVEFACGLDPKAKAATAVGVTSIPCVLLLDPKGVVLYQGHPAAITEQTLQLLTAKAE